MKWVPQDLCLPPLWVEVLKSYSSLLKQPSLSVDQSIPHKQEILTVRDTCIHWSGYLPGSAMYTSEEPQLLWRCRTSLLIGLVFFVCLLFCFEISFLWFVWFPHHLWSFLQEVTLDFLVIFSACHVHFTSEFIYAQLLRGIFSLRWVS